ncbi:lipoxygenase 2.1, chloroplastic-like isoform X2 [Oryza glaberrima]|uniref:lipoxygenase 2.1, chloroplastic-like isoform X2 n=1 Tax=Oryza glaberrima TaxID=4538 RepID=UPI00224C2687|nr:lipoxygenase 2.1, chloroplastic-like isoform X2 [Oryza glaberrima]
MLMATQPLGPVLSPSHGGPSSFSSSVSLGGQWAPRRPAVSSKVSCTRIGLSEVDNGKVVGHIDVDEEEQTMQVQGITTVTATVAVRLKEGISTPEKVADMVNRNWLFLDFFSSSTERHTEPQPAKYLRMDDVTGSFIYESSFGVRSSFGAIGAVNVVNRFNTEVYISDIEVHLHGGHHHSSAVTFQCNSWITCNNPNDRRFFFPLKSSYLPSQTPRGVKNLRKEELKTIRGNGRGERKEWERVYDYDVYNDLGDPDNDPATRRPVLGGRERPYPRRCRTGRRRCRADPSSESPPATADGIYVPRDEAFTERRAGVFATKRALSMLSAFTTARRVSGDRRRSFPSLAAIDALYEDGYKNRPPSSQPEADDVDGYLAGMVQRQVKLLLKEDKLAWLRDEEFARQTLAGMNPLSIQLVRDTEFPIFSKLDEETYGPGDSLITRELIEGQINGVMTAEEAVEKKKLFMLDYHDVLLPFVHAVRELDDTTLYASRTLFFLTEEGTLRPIAIELTRPKSPNTPQWRQVFTPAGTSVTASWLWQLAKTHVLAHDAGYHQLVSHWLRTHCCVEPYVIAANRRLSQMHPIYRLLHPHFRFTMEINAQARGMLINANGIIESAFAPGKHCMELSSAVYDKFWRFDMEALPADLIRRGMAIECEDGELELTIEDYPYANDGLLIWDSIKEWVSDYVNHYYLLASDIHMDKELQGWWNEVRTKGHPDKKEGWPELDCHGSLVEVLTTIIWVASGHHAAVNFGQYPYAGYFPNRPTIARRNMPTEEQGCGREGMQPTFVEDPVRVLLDTFPSQYQTTLVLPVLNLLSSHSPGEEYIGTHAESAWMADREVRAAFGRFNERMMSIAETIDCRNKDPERKNRQGPGVVPYVLLKPSYGDPKDMTSVMEMGIPTSISI